MPRRLAKTVSLTSLLSTAQNSNSNLLKHLEKQHASTKLVAKESKDPDSSDSSEATPSKQQRLDFNRGTASQGKLDQVDQQILLFSNAVMVLK